MDMNFVPIWFWLGLAVLLIILEVLFGAHFFLFWLGTVSLVVSAITWFLPEVHWQYQLLIFALGALISIIAWRQFIKSHPFKDEHSTLNRRMQQYVGRTFTLEDPIVNGIGRVKVGDTYWRVEGPNLAAGTEVIVVGVEGVTLKVKEK
jgi:membrane protein implicated in regulation of membrane protease activity